MKDFHDICSYFHIARHGQHTAQAYCPVHAGGNEKNPSLTLSEGSDGRTLLYCHVCGKEGTPAILNAVGLQMTDIMPEQKRHGKTVKSFAEWPGKRNEFSGARFVEAYEYANEQGYAYTKCRISVPDGAGGRDKSFRYCRTDAEGLVEEFSVKNRRDYNALFPFRCIQKARETSGTILFVEGERDAKSAERDGFPAVTAGGANDWVSTLTKHFQGLKVIVVPDKDAPGYKSAAVIAEDLAAAGVTVRVISWPEGFQAKGDYSDFVGSFSDRADGITAFRGLIDNALSVEDFLKSREQDPAEPSTETEAREVALKIRDLEGGKIFPVTDLKAGELIGKIFDQCRYNTTAKSWYYFDGKRLTLDAESMHVEHAAAVFCDALLLYSLFYLNDDVTPEERLAFRRQCEGLTKRARRIAAIQDARKYNAFSSADTDKNPSLFNVQNGVYDTDTFQLLPHSPDLMLSKIAGCEYRPEAQSQDFAEFIDQVLQGDQEKIRFLQTFCGYILAGRPVEECFLILYGATTRNGKGTFCETLLRMFGDYGASIRPETLAVKKSRDGSAASDDIARLAGVRFLNCSEPAKGLHLDEALVKSLTGGDKITARHLFERFFEFYPQFTIMMNVNFLPVVTDATLFASGRVMVLPFERHFEEAEQDKGLKARLQEPENLSAVFNWCIEGLRRYREEGLQLPASVICATSEYADDSDKVKRFWNDELEKCSGSAVKGADVYERYKEWCSASGLYAESKQNFFQLLRGRGLLQKTGVVNGISFYNVVPDYRLIDREFVEAEADELPAEWR